MDSDEDQHVCSVNPCSRFRELVKNVTETGAHVHLTDDGESIAVIVPAEWYEEVLSSSIAVKCACGELHLFSKKNLDRISAASRRSGKTALDMSRIPEHVDWLGDVNDADIDALVAVAGLDE